MDKVFSCLHLYDILACFVPGIFTVIYIAFGLKLLNFPPQTFSTNILTESIAFFVVCYYVGLIVQEIGKFVETYDFKRLFKDTFSNGILLKDSKIISIYDKRKCWNVLKEHFGIGIDLRIQNKNKLKEKIMEYGHLLYVRCREALKFVYKNTDKLNQSEIFNIQYGLSRNLAATSLVALGYFSTINVWLIMQCGSLLNMSLPLILFFYVCSRLFYNRSKRFACYHVQNVITLYLSTYDNSNSPRMTI